MMKYFIIQIILFICVSTVWAQDKKSKSIVLDSVYLQAELQSKFYYAYDSQLLDKDSLSLQSLNEIIKNQTAVFMREYGRGMLSSVSLRGTGASHTQVVWNGIPINSILNGQTDFNTVSANLYDQIILKKGGSSVDFGSGAMGGIVLLNDIINYKNIPETQLQNLYNIGSFQSVSNFSLLKYANKKWYFKTGFQLRQSDNDYPYIGYEFQNDNGAYTGLDFGIVAGYKINRFAQTYFKNQNSFFDRELSRTLYQTSQSELITRNNRYLWGFVYQKDQWTWQTDWAYLFESYQYFANKNTTVADRSLSDVYTVKNTISYRFNHNSHLYIKQSFTHQQGQSAHFDDKKRKIWAADFIWGQSFVKWKYDLKVRKEFNKTYQIPWIGAIETIYNVYKNWWLKANISKNFRLPTFNDLYWQPFGNPNLKPEKSYAVETGIQFDNDKNHVSFTAYYIDSQNLIKWTPDNDQWWSPKNITHACYNGIELSVQHRFMFTSNQYISFKINYTYQQATDLLTRKQIPYTPQHIGLTTLEYKYKKLKIKYINRFTGKIFTTSSNTKYISAVDLHHIVAAYAVNNHIQAGGSIHNLFNTYYETFPSRPEPGINYNLYINFKI